MLATILVCAGVYAAGFFSGVCLIAFVQRIDDPGCCSDSNCSVCNGGSL